MAAWSSSPILIDEVQKTPKLFEQIKVICGEKKGKRADLADQLSAVQDDEKIRETLAGRIGILELYSLSAREKAELIFDTDLDFSLSILHARQCLFPDHKTTLAFLLTSAFQFTYPAITGS